jgi:Spy/CpxP family protein refolding chaperone
MLKHIKTALTVIALLCGVTAYTALAQVSGTSSAYKMTNQQVMDKMNHMSTVEKANMFDRMTHQDKMEAMKMSGHDMSKMSHKERTEMMGKLTPEQKADMFDKMPMDTRMATMRMAVKEHAAK